jgi:hypothetical protein
MDTILSSQELGVLIDRILVHASAAVTVGLVAQVEAVVLRREAQAHHTGLQVAVRLAGSLLAAVGRKAGHRDAQWRAGIAAVAMGAISEHATAAKAAGHQP